MKSILKYILLAGIRDRLYIGLFITLAASFSLSIFLGSTSFVEAQQTTAAYIAGFASAWRALSKIKKLSSSSQNQSRVSSLF
jgi:hypothetical protein